MTIPGIRFFQFDNGEDKKELVTLLTGNIYKGSFAASRLLRYLEYSSCHTAVLEDGYIDRDFADAYGRLYARGYRIHPRFCQRLHFFSCKMSENDFEQPELEQGKRMQDCYSGYSVIPPSIPQTLGRTVIKPLKNSTEFVLASDEFPINLLGFSLRAKGTPFIEQDHRVSACATAALWMAATAINKKYNIPYYSTTEITELASRKIIGSGRAIPSEGLTVQQMLDALQTMGYDTMCFEDFDAGLAKDIVYKQVESQLPVILAVEFLQGRHALTVIGHLYGKFDPQNKWIHPAWGEYGSSWQPLISSQWVPGFIVNCDQRGLYQKLYFLHPEEMPKEFIKIFEDEKKEKVKCGVKIAVESIETTDPKEEFAALRAVIVILPKQVFLIGNQAEPKAYSIILQAYRQIYGQPPPQDIVLRTYMTSSNDFKASLLDSTLRPTPPCQTLIQLYRVQRFSRQVWVTEIGQLSGRNGKDSNDLLIQGEVILDTSSSARSLDFISLHLKGKFIFMSPAERDYEKAINRLKNTEGQFVDNVPDDADYSPIERFS